MTNDTQRTFGSQKPREENREPLMKAKAVIGYMQVTEDTYKDKTRERFTMGFVPVGIEDGDASQFRESTKTGALWDWYNLGSTKDCQFAVFLIGLLNAAKKAKVKIPGVSFDPRGGDDGKGALHIDDFNELPQTLLGLVVDIEKTHMICGDRVSKDKWVVTKVHGMAEDEERIGPKAVPRNSPAPTSENALPNTAVQMAPAAKAAMRSNSRNNSNSGEEREVPEAWTNLDDDAKRGLMQRLRTDPTSAVEYLSTDVGLPDGDAENIVDYVRSEFKL